MNANGTATGILADVRIDVKLKLAALWTSVLFLMIYVDYFALYVPGFVENIIAGEVGHTGIQVTQLFLVSAMTLMMIPSLMIFLSLALKPAANRWTNIIAGTFKLVVVLALAVGETWGYYIFASIVEAALFVLIIRYAWKWPRQEEQDVTEAL